MQTFLFLIGALEKGVGECGDIFVDLLKNRNEKSLPLKHKVIDGDHQAAFPMTGLRSVTWLSGLQD